MAWTITEDPEEMLAAAGGFLRADPVENTVPLSVLETIRQRGVHAYGPTSPVLGWWTEGRDVRGAFHLTPPRGVLLTAMPEVAARELAGELAEREVLVPGVGGRPAEARAFAAAWNARSGTVDRVHLRQRLHRLGRLEMPRPGPPGALRTAGDGDRDLVAAWYEAFEREALGPRGHRSDPAAIDHAVGQRRVMLWEADGVPVALAGHAVGTEGVVRVAPVYTPPEQRGRGFGSAVTAALTRNLLAAGAREVVLFTDLANPVSNAVYRRIGYRPVSDRLDLVFAMAV